MARISLVKGGQLVNKKTFVPNKPTPEVAGASTSIPSNLNAAQLGGARGDGFAESFTAAGGAEQVKKGESITTASQTVKNKLRIKPGTPVPPKKGLLKKKKEKIRKKGKTDALASDLMRASAFNSTESQSTVSEGAKSSRTGAPNDMSARSPQQPLSDAEVNTLIGQGYQEGDYVPNKGILKPDGTFDNSIVQKLNDAQAEALRLQEQVKSLRNKDTSNASNATSSDTPVVNEESSALGSIKDAAASSPTNAALALLDKEIQSLGGQLRGDINSIESDYKTAQQDLQGRQAQETGKLSAGIAQAGGYLGFSGSGTGVMLSLAKSHRAELMALDAKRQKAINDARVASANRRFDLVREKAQEIARIDQETYTRQEKYNERVREEADKEQEQARVMQNQNDIFKAIEGGAKSPQDIFKALSGKVDINDINKFLEQVTPKSDGKFKYSATDTAGLLGSGMSLDDISALNEFVNENGYTDEVRNNLTPRQRAAADKIYKLKTGAAVDDGSDTGIGVTLPDGTQLLSTTQQVLDGFTSLKDLTPTARAKVRKQLYELGLGDEQPADWFDKTLVEEQIGRPLDRDFLEGYFGYTFNEDAIDASMNAHTRTYIKEQWNALRRQILDEKDDAGGGDSGLGNFEDL